MFEKQMPLGKLMLFLYMLYLENKAKSSYKRQDKYQHANFGVVLIMLDFSQNSLFPPNPSIKKCRVSKI